MKRHVLVGADKPRVLVDVPTVLSDLGTPSPYVLVFAALIDDGNATRYLSTTRELASAVETSIPVPIAGRVTSLQVKVNTLVPHNDDAGTSTFSVRHNGDTVGMFVRVLSSLPPTGHGVTKPLLTDDENTFDVEAGDTIGIIWVHNFNGHVENVIAIVAITPE